MYLKPVFIAEYRNEILGNFELHHKVSRVGPGENGGPVDTPVDQQRAADESIAEFGFNMVARRKVSLDRQIKDTRHPEYGFITHSSCVYYILE